MFSAGTFAPQMKQPPKCRQGAQEHLVCSVAQPVNLECLHCFLILFLKSILRALQGIHTELALA